MSKMSRLFDEALLKIKLNEKKSEAEYIIKDEARLQKLLDKVKDKLKHVPVVGTYLEEIPLLVNMLIDYKNKKYTKLPTSSIVSIIAALVYFLSPMDLVPDFIVSLGLLDDALVLKVALDGIRYNIHEYQEWKHMNQEGEAGKKDEIILEATEVDVEDNNDINESENISEEVNRM